MNTPSLSFKTLINEYAKFQSELTKQVESLATSNSSGTNPAKFLLLQFKMSQVTQMGESISNLVAQLNSLINSSIRNQKSQ